MKKRGEHKITLKKSFNEDDIYMESECIQNDNEYTELILRI